MRDFRRVEHDRQSFRAVNLAGLARVLDLLLVFPQPGDYERLLDGNASFLRTWAHEWTHYFQFVSTNVGHALINLYTTQYLAHQTLFLWLQRDHGWDGRSPALMWKHINDSSAPQSSTRLRDLLREFDSVLTNTSSVRLEAMDTSRHQRKDRRRYRYLRATEPPPAEYRWTSGYARSE
jgi:hypothetical protein